MKLPAYVLALALLATAGCGGAAAPPPARHVILISLDTLRADHLSCYDPESPARTPSLDALAATAVRFDDCTSAAPTTLASHVSLLSGTWPHTHGVFRNGYVVNPANRMMAELLAERGFRTAGFAGSFALTGLVEIGQGFEHWDDAFDERIRYEDPEPNQRRAAAVTDAVLGWLDGRSASASSEPLFLFAHYFDAHHPYDPPAPYRPAVPDELTGEIADQRRAVDRQQRAILGAGRGLDNVIVEGLAPELVREADGEPRGIDRDLARLYAGEVEYLDHHLGRLFAGLRERGLWDDALVIVTADHGETFWEHGDFWNHGLAVYQTTVRVPLVVKLPGTPAERVARRPVSLVDVLPTVLELIDAPAPSGVEGHSLVADLVGAPPDVPSEVFSEATQPARRELPELVWKGACKARMVRDGALKYVWTPYLEIEELYDLGTDPGERTNLLARDAEGARRDADRLRARLDAWDLAADPLPTVHSVRALRERGEAGDAGALAPEDFESMLESLGYVGGEAGATERSSCSE